MRLETDPARLLLCALRRSAALAGCRVAIAHEALTPWASATFVGGQHRVAVAGERLNDWLATLPDADLPMRDHLVASLDVAPTFTGATLTVLVLEA